MGGEAARDQDRPQPRCCSRSTWAPAMAASRAAGTALEETAEEYAFVLTQMGAEDPH